MMAKNSDDIVQALMDKVKAKQAEIKKLGKPRWLTTCTIGFSSSVSDRVNIMTRNDPAELVEIYSKLLGIEAKWDEANKDLGLEVPATHQNYPISDWKADVKTRAGQISIDKKKKELASLESRLDKLVTPEKRRELELAAIQKELEESE